MIKYEAKRKRKKIKHEKLYIYIYIYKVETFQGKAIKGCKIFIFFSFLSFVRNPGFL